MARNAHATGKAHSTTRYPPFVLHLGPKKLRGPAAEAEYEKAMELADENLDALWWRDGREGPWCVMVWLPRTKTGRTRFLDLAHSHWPTLKRQLRQLGLQSQIRAAEVKVT